MRSNRARVAVVAAAIGLAVVAFLALRPSDREDDAAGPATASQEDGSGAADGGTGAEPERGAPKPEVTTVEIEDGRPVGGMAEIEVTRGETIEFVVKSDAPDELHVHGYELTQEVAPGDPARFEFEADLEGIYEVEAHDIGHVPVVELRIGP